MVLRRGEFRPLLGSWVHQAGRFAIELVSEMRLCCFPFPSGDLITEMGDVRGRYRRGYTDLDLRTGLVRKDQQGLLLVLTEQAGVGSEGSGSYV